MPIAERFLASFFLASGVTFALLWVMQALVAVEDIEIDSRPLPSIVAFVRLEQAPRPLPEKVRKPKLQSPDKLPPPGLPLTEGVRNGHGLFDEQGVEDLGTGEEGLDGRTLAQSDGEAVPLVRVPPRYPERALQRGVEGRVLVEFTIGRSGAVESARVVASEPSSVFEDAALGAVRQWRYNPRIDNGVAVEQHGIRVAIPFRLSREDSR